MVFKLLALSVACLAFTVQPVQCGIISKLSNIKSATTGAVSDIASIVPNVLRAQGKALVQAAARTGNIVAVGAGLKVEALERATSSMTGAVSNGLAAIGRLLSRQGSGVAENALDNSPYDLMGQIPTNGDAFRRRKIGKFGRRTIVRSPYAYDVVYTPRVYRGPHGFIRIE